MKVIKLLHGGLKRVADGEVGMTFVVDRFQDGVAGRVAHVRDYRFVEAHGERRVQTWSIAEDGYEEIMS